MNTRLFVGVLIMLICVVTSSFGQNITFVPKKTGEKEVLHYQEFSLSYSEAHEQPLWVAYDLTAEELKKPSRDRISKFKQDKNVRTKSLTHDDYTHSGYHRGHISRAMYNKATELSYRESYLMSNISPQLPGCNTEGGTWFQLEEWEVAMAKKYGEVYCVSGPVFKDNLTPLKSGFEVPVPGYFYKAIYTNNGGDKGIAFIITHDERKKVPRVFVQSIDSLEVLTGINFFPSLKNSIEKRVEASSDIGEW